MARRILFIHLSFQIALLTGTGTLTIDPSLTDADACAEVVDDIGFEAEPIVEIPLEHSAMTLLLSNLALAVDENMSSFSDKLRNALEVSSTSFCYRTPAMTPALIQYAMFNTRCSQTASPALVRCLQLGRVYRRSLRSNSAQ